MVQNYENLLPIEKCEMTTGEKIKRPSKIEFNDNLGQLSKALE